MDTVVTSSTAFSLMNLPCPRISLCEMGMIP